MNQKLSNPFTRNISFRPSVQSSVPSTGYFYQSQVTPVMSTSPFKQKHSLNSLNYGPSPSHNYAYSNSYNMPTTQQKYSDYSPPKYSQTNSNHLLDRNPFKRTSLFQPKVDQPKYHQPTHWRDTPETTYAPERIDTYYNEKSDTASVYTYINKINDLDDGKSSYGPESNNPFNRKNLLQKNQNGKSKEYLHFQSERQYQPRRNSEAQYEYKDYDHLVYKPNSNYSRPSEISGYDSYSKQLKSMEENKKLSYEYDLPLEKQTYNHKFNSIENAEDEKYGKYVFDPYAYEKKSENHPKKQYNQYDKKDYDYQYEKKDYSHGYDKKDTNYQYENNYPQQNYNYEKYEENPYQKNSKFDKYDDYEQKPFRHSEQPVDYDFKDKLYERQSSENIRGKSNPFQRDQPQYKYNHEYQEPKFGSKTYDKPEMQPNMKYYQSPDFNEGVNKKQNIVQFDDDEEEQPYQKPTFDASSPSSLEIRGKIYHLVKFVN